MLWQRQSRQAISEIHENACSETVLTMTSAVSLRTEWEEPPLVNSPGRFVASIWPGESIK
jgi:hypothetical protein